jgi:hypothetical protein
MAKKPSGLKVAMDSAPLENIWAKSVRFHSGLRMYILLSPSPITLKPSRLAELRAAHLADLPRSSCTTYGSKGTETSEGC